jgi:hypothetical protein
MREIMVREAQSCDLKELVAKFIPEVIGKEIEKATSGIYPLQNTYIRKVKILKAPKFDLTKLMEVSHDGKGFFQHYDMLYNYCFSFLLNIVWLIVFCLSNKYCVLPDYRCMVTTVRRLGQRLSVQWETMLKQKLSLLKCLEHRQQQELTFGLQSVEWDFNFWNSYSICIHQWLWIAVCLRIFVNREQIILDMGLTGKQMLC